MKKNLLKIIPVILIAITSCKKEIDTTSTSVAKQDVVSPVITKQDHSASYVANELLVKFKSGSTITHHSQALQKIEGRVKEKLLTKAMRRSGDNEGIQVITIPGDVKAAVAKMKALTEVEYAEPNYLYEHAALSNDPFYENNSLWGMYGDASPLQQNIYGSQAAEAWAANHTGRSSVHIGIIDQGVMINHDDLVANIWVNPFDPVDGVDNDDNGYVDDIHGWNFYHRNNNVFEGVSDWHGTHVAGTIGAKGGNNIGVAGVNWNVSIIVAKFLGKGGASIVDAVMAMDYFTDLKIRHNLTLPATNNSWGGGFISEALQEAVARAGEAEILVIAAAHNYSLNIDETPIYPAAYTNDNIISVAAIEKTGDLASYSDYGSTSVDLGAPGSEVYSTYPGKYKGQDVSIYGTLWGTSMATPHVTGAAALYAARHPNATAAQIKNAILSSTIPTASLAGKTVTGGRLNLSNF